MMWLRLIRVGTATGPIRQRVTRRFRVFNIGNNNPVELLHYISTLEAALGRKAELEFLPLQPGDVPVTSAETNALERQVGYRPATSVETGVGRFVDWYMSYYRRGALAS